MTATLCLGPLLFHWTPERRRDFYFHIADEAPLDVVYLGEVVCPKRCAIYEPYMDAIAERLRSAGKEIILSTPALITNDQEMAVVRRSIEAAQGWVVEANDLGVVSVLAGQPHVIGPYISVYNEGTLKELAARGAVGVCLSGELPAPSLSVLAASNSVSLEVQVFGRLPLAISVRCYHARARHVTKGSCGFVCARDTDGLAVTTLDNEPFVVLNGTQVLSHSYVNLVAELGGLRRMGINRFRLSPHDLNMVLVARIYRDVADGEREPGAAIEDLRRVTAGAPMADGFFHGVEGQRWSHRRG